MTEEALQKQLIEKLQGIESPYLMDTEVPIPYQHIYVPDGKDTKLEVWCFKQDIAIYQPLFERDPEDRKDYVITDKNNTSVKVEFKNSKKIVGLPFVILELKKKQPNTHSILAYSQKAKMIKTIFPYCQYLFLIYGKKIAPRTYRLGEFFDEIIQLQNTEGQEIEKLKKTLLKHIEIAENKLEKIKHEESDSDD
ncbi:hypothetical protein Barb4_00122 [Bacteroidales bacterium Barb4]|nr:hypothetical protein Barb4_00122 [Bacteroidales bacterium Barb4]